MLAYLATPSVGLEHASATHSERSRALDATVVVDKRARLKRFYIIHEHERERDCRGNSEQHADDDVCVHSNPQNEKRPGQLRLARSSGNAFQCCRESRRNRAPTPQGVRRI